jgi:hypothetical protein
MGAHLGRCASPTTPTIENLPHLPRDSLRRSNRLLLALSGILT